MSSWIQHVIRKTGGISWIWKVSRNRKNDINRKTTKAIRCDGGISLGMTCPPMCSLPVSAIRSAPPHSSSAWGVEKCADIKTRGFATVQTQWHNRSGRWCEGGEAPRAVCSQNISSIPLFPDMSASPMARAATQGQDIPTRRVVITSEEDMPTGVVKTDDLAIDWES